MSQGRISTTLFDEKLRRNYLLLLGFSGAGFSASGTVSIFDVQEYFLKNMPDILTIFPQYDNYFTLATWLSFFAGLIFLLMPVTLTLWLSSYLFWGAVVCLVSAGTGIMAVSPPVFWITYMVVVIVAVFSYGQVFNWYRKSTKYDVYVLIMIQTIFVVLASINFFTLVRSM